MYTATLLDHFQHPRNAGELPAPAVAVERSNPACGDILRLSLLVVEERIGDVRFKAKGCAPAIACGSALTELVKGKLLDEAALLRAEDIARALGALPPEGSHAAVLAIDALRAALERAGKAPS